MPENTNICRVCLQRLVRGDEGATLLRPQKIQITPDGLRVLCRGCQTWNPAPRLLECALAMYLSCVMSSSTHVSVTR